MYIIYKGSYNHISVYNNIYIYIIILYTMCVYIIFSGYGAGKGCGGAHIKNRNCHGGDMTIPGIRKTLGGPHV